MFTKISTILYEWVESTKSVKMIAPYFLLLHETVAIPPSFLSLPMCGVHVECPLSTYRFSSPITSFVLSIFLSLGLPPPLYHTVVQLIATRSKTKLDIFTFGASTEKSAVGIHQRNWILGQWSIPTSPSMLNSFIFR